MLTSVRVHSELRRKNSERKRDRLWSCIVLTTSATAPWLLTCKSQPGICYCLKTRTHKHTLTHTHTQREIRVHALAIQKSHRGHTDLGAGGRTDGWTDGWMVGEKTGWQDDKTELRTRSSTMWQLGRPTREWGSGEEDGKENREKKAGEETRGQTSVGSLFCGFHHMVSGGGRGSESQPGRTHFTYHFIYKINLLLHDFKLTDKFVVLKLQ